MGPYDQYRVNILVQAYNMVEVQLFKNSHYSFESHTYIQKEGLSKPLNRSLSKMGACDIHYWVKILIKVYAMVQASLLTTTHHIINLN